MNQSNKLPKAPVVSDDEARNHDFKTDVVAGGQWPGAFTAFGEALKRIKDHPLPAAVIVIPTALSQLIPFRQLHLESMVGYGRYEFNAYALGLQLLVSILFILAIPTYALAIADQKKLTVKAMFLKNLSLFKLLSFIAAYIVITIAIGVSLLALVVPVIWVFAWVYLTTYIVVDKGLNPIQALKRSYYLAYYHKAKVWGVFGVTVLLTFILSIVSSIPVVGLAVGAVVSAVLSLVSVSASAILYRWLEDTVTIDE